MKLRPNVKGFLITPNDYEVIKFINRGSFREVNLVENKTTHKQFAAKTILDSDGTNQETSKLISHEISILSRFHVHVQTIIRFYGYSTKDFKDRPFINLFTEYKDGGSLHDLLEKERQQRAPPDYNNTSEQIILRGIAHGVMTLHS